MSLEQLNHRRVLPVLFIGVLMGALDIAVVGPALPVVRDQFAVSDRALPWVFSIYVLFHLIGAPLMAKLSDQFGRRSIYILDVSLFALGSLVVALSPRFVFLLLGRAIQGLGAGGIFPVASAVIGDTFPPDKRGRALGLIGAVFGLAFLVGPLLGALFLNLASWHWLFLINLPIAALVIGLALRAIPSVRPARVRGFDALGMAVLAVLLVSLAWGLNQIEVSRVLPSLLSLRVLPFLVLSLLLLFLFAAVERHARNPIMPPDLFDRRQLRLTYALATGAGIAESSLVFLPLLAFAALSGHGVSESTASYFLLPVVLAMSVGAPTAGRLLDKFGSRVVVLTGTTVLMAGMVILGLFSRSLPLFLASGVLIGLGMSALNGAPLRYIMLSEARMPERSAAQGVVTLFTSAGRLLGGTLTGAIAASQPEAGMGYSLAFLFIGLSSLVLVAAAGRLKNRGQELETIRRNETEKTAGGEQENLPMNSGAVVYENQF